MEVYKIEFEDQKNQTRKARDKVILATKNGQIDKPYTFSGPTTNVLRHSIERMRVILFYPYFDLTKVNITFCRFF